MRYEIAIYKNNKRRIRDNKKGCFLSFPEIEAMLNELDIRRNRKKSTTKIEYPEVDKFFKNNEKLSLDDLILKDNSDNTTKKA